MAGLISWAGGITINFVGPGPSQHDSTTLDVATILY